MSVDSGGPYLAAALICEKVLHEKDGVFSIIRMVDRLTVSLGPNAPAKMPPLQIPLNVFLGFKSGIAKGNYVVKLTGENPSGEEKELAILNVLFEGDDRGNNLQITINLQAEEDGLYWFG